MSETVTENTPAAETSMLTPASPAAPTAAADTKPAAPPAAAPSVPAVEVKPADAAALAEKAEAAKLDAAVAKLELKLPAGVDAADPKVAEFKKAFASGNAQALYDLQAKSLAEAQKDFSKSTLDGFAATRAQWVAELKADKTYGGANFPVTQAAIAKVLARYPLDAETQAFLASGPGDHPGLVRWIATLAKDLAEDTVAPKGGTRAVSPPPKQTDDERFRSYFPNSPELFAQH